MTSWSSRSTPSASRLSKTRVCDGAAVQGYLSVATQQRAGADVAQSAECAKDTAGSCDAAERANNEQSGYQAALQIVSAKPYVDVAVVIIGEEAE
ncbi:hypothetical protein MTO96_035906 [Rhipicephalus appendiculatus]